VAVIAANYEVPAHNGFLSCSGMPAGRRETP
jgi:hypothetical protein